MKFYNKTPGERLQWLLLELSITPYKLSQILDYKSPDTVYNIINGKNSISENFINRIKLSDLPINIEWLKTGFGEPKQHEIERGQYGNELVHNHKIIYPKDLNYYYINQIAKKLSTFLGIEDKSYKVEVKVSGILGLEYKFSTYHIENKHSSIDKQYSFIIAPDWQIISFFDFWKSMDINLRCQNMIYLLKDKITQRLNNVVYELQTEIIKLSETSTDNEDLFDEIFLKENQTFVEIYKTDARIKQ